MATLWAAFPDRWWALAEYNAERSRGLIHAPEVVEAMMVEQERFDLEQLVDMCQRYSTVLPVPGGGWLCIP